MADEKKSHQQIILCVACEAVTTFPSTVALSAGDRQDAGRAYEDYCFSIAEVSCCNF